MKLHANARTCPHSRRLAVERVERDGWTLATVAEAAGVSVRTVSKWLRRYRAEGAQGLLDRCSTPRSVPLRTSEERVAVIAALRRLRMTGAEIAETLAMPISTVSGILSRIGLGKSGGWSRSSRRTATRRSGRASSSMSTSRSSAGSAAAPATASPATGAGRAAPITQRATTGWEYVHVAIDDATRLVYVEVLADEKAVTAVVSSAALSRTSPPSASGSSG